MSTTTVERTSKYFKYIFQAWKAPKADSGTRVALVAHQLGLSDQDLEPFYRVRRKGASKRHFSYEEFAERYGISINWLQHGYLPEHPRNLKPVRKVRRANGEAMAKKRGVRTAIRLRIREVAVLRDLSGDAIKLALTTKHFHLAQFAEQYAVNIEWLLTGKGRIFEKDRTKPSCSRALSPKEFAQALEMLPETTRQKITAKVHELAVIETALAKAKAELQPQP